MRILGFLIGLFLIPGLARAGETQGEARLKMEGVIASEGVPGGWSAILNGQVVAPGQTVEGFELLSVDEKGVQLKELRTGKVEYVQAGEESKPAAAASAEAPPKEWWEIFLERYFPALANYKEQFQYAWILRDLKRVYSEAMQYAITEGKEVSVDLLVGVGKLPPSFRGGTSSGYKLSIQNLDNGSVRISADPLGGRAGKRHFLIDEHGYIYSETGRPATQSSARFDSGYSVSVLPS